MTDDPQDNQPPREEEAHIPQPGGGGEQPAPAQQGPSGTEPSQQSQAGEPAAPTAGQGSSGTVQPPAAAGESPSGRAIAALVLGIIGLVLCPPTAVAAWILGHLERKDIREGKAPAAGAGLATGGFVTGIIGTSLLVLYVIAAILFVVSIAVLGSAGGGDFKFD